MFTLSIILKIKLRPTGLMHIVETSLQYYQSGRRFFVFKHSNKNSILFSETKERFRMNQFEKVSCTFLSAKRVRTITLKDFFQNELQIAVYATEFQDNLTKAIYQGVRLKTSNGLKFEDFEAVIAESVHQMVVELGLFDKPLKEIKENESESWNRLIEKCQAFVYVNFSFPSKHSLEFDKTYNNFISNMVDLCLYSASCMLLNSEEEIDYKLGTHLFKTYSKVLNYDWELEDIGETLVLNIPKENIIKPRWALVHTMLGKFSNIFKYQPVESIK